MKQVPGHTVLLEVTSLEQLAALARVQPWLLFGATPKISLQLPLISAAQQRTTEKRLNFWLEVCGCTAGALLVLASLAWYVVGAAPAFDGTLGAVLRRVVVVIGVGMVGKAAALLSTRLLFIADTSLFVFRLRHEAQRRCAT
jgi:hypothetical protein